MEDTRPTEETRLLPAEDEVVDAEQTPIDKLPSLWRILLPSIVVMFLLSAGNQLSLVPSTVILEERVCNDYYNRTEGFRSSFFGSSASHTGSFLALNTTERCKAEPVQSEISLILGWRDVFEELPGKYRFPFSYHGLI